MTQLIGLLQMIYAHRGWYPLDPVQICWWRWELVKIPVSMPVEVRL